MSRGNHNKQLPIPTFSYSPIPINVKMSNDLVVNEQKLKSEPIQQITTIPLIIPSTEQQPSPSAEPQPSEPIPTSTKTPEIPDQTKQIITKTTIRIDQSDSKVLEGDIVEDEINTIEYDGEIVAHETCNFCIHPITDKPISNIINAYPVLYEANFNVEHCIIAPKPGDKYFNMCLRNNGDETIKIKVHYNVAF